MHPPHTLLPLATMQLVTAEGGVHPIAPPLPHASLLWNICRAGRVRELEGFIHHYGTEQLGTRIDQHGNTPVMVALQAAPLPTLIPMCRLLLTAGERATGHNDAGESAMLIAASRPLPAEAMLELLTLLVRYGAHPNRSCQDGLTPLQMLLCHGSLTPELITGLGPLGFDLSQPGSSGMTPLMMVIRYAPERCSQLVGAMLDAPVRDARLAANPAEQAYVAGTQRRAPLGTAAHVALFFAPDEEAKATILRLTASGECRLEAVAEQMGNVTSLLRMLADVGSVRSFNAAPRLILELRSRRGVPPLRPTPQTPAAALSQPGASRVAPPTPAGPPAPPAMPMTTQPAGIERYDLWDAARLGQTAVVMGHLALRPELFLRGGSRAQQGVLPLTMAALHNQRETLAAMLAWVQSTGATQLRLPVAALISQVDAKGQTALCAAVQAGAHHGVRALLAAGADPTGTVPKKMLGRHKALAAQPHPLVSLAIVAEKAFTVRLLVSALLAKEGAPPMRWDAALALAEKTSSTASATYQTLLALRRQAGIASTSR